MLNRKLHRAIINSEGEWSLNALFTIFWQSKLLISGITVIAILIGVIYALNTPNVYRAQAVLAPSDENAGGGISAMAGQLGGLASLAGVNLNKGQVDKATMAIEVLKSRAFINNFIHHRAIAVELFASKGWDGERIIINSDIYDENTNSWNKNFLIGSSTVPSDWDLYDKFRKILFVNQDNNTGLVSISIEHHSPIIAKNWVDWLVSDLNKHIRENDIEEAKTSVQFLEKQLKETSVTDMQSMFYQLIEKQVRTIMLASVREQYMFKALDPAVIPQEKIKPKRILIVILSGVIGLFFGVAFSLFVNFRNARPD